jgi:signal transduction histidine kinase
VRLSEELKQRAIDLFGVRPADVVGAAVDADEADVGDQVGEPVGGRGDRQDPVLRAVDDERGYVDLRGIVAEVGEPGVDARELAETAISNTEARTELAASRARLVAAADEERRRVVRDLHDGAQQRLVHTVITLKLAERELQGQDGRASELVREALAQAENATAELRELAHGILPAVLTRGGLRASVAALASRMTVPVEVDVSAVRAPQPIEAIAYFVVAEALTNVAKHARARRATVTARADNSALRVEVRDDGAVGAQPDGSGLIGLRDRLAAHDGTLTIDSPPGGGTVVTATIPLPAPA